MDRPPLAEGNWPLMSASALPYGDGGQRAARDDARRHGPHRDDFVAATQRAAEAGFDWLELHCAHGYLLSSFLSPLTNQRTTTTAAALENRAALPAGGASAMRAAWPQDRPMSVRISATTGSRRQHADDAVAIARPSRPPAPT
jgi:anthraniloyl-CoA monooxygenase